MTVVLGIDAAWTARGSSGVSVVMAEERRARLLALAPSYAAFLALAEGRRERWQGASGQPPPVASLLAAAGAIADRPVSVVAVDMPLAKTPISGRRGADDEISRTFGGAGCGTHSPLPGRPGAISQQLTRGFAAHGYPLATVGWSPGRVPALIEVYPHVALLRLCRAERRLAYKVARSHRYWPGVPAAERLDRLRSTWSAIFDRLACEIAGIEPWFPWDEARRATTLSGLKPFEDALDALICAWVGLRFAAGRATAYGDARAAIWVPD